MKTDEWKNVGAMIREFERETFGCPDEIGGVDDQSEFVWRHGNQCFRASDGQYFHTDERGETEEVDEITFRDLLLGFDINYTV